MMKKLYIAPEVELIEIAMEKVIAASQISNAPAAMNTSHSASEWGDWE